MGVDGSPRPGFDHWVSVPGQGGYFNPEINENGKLGRVPGYVTDIFNERAVSFIERPRQKPFVLYVAHKALHPNVTQLAGVDEGMGRIFDALRRKGELDNTVIVFAGDNGYFYGGHGLSEERRLAYEESIRIPLLLRYPGAVKPRTAVDGFALNVNVAPTFLDFASAPALRRTNGRSPRPLVEGRAADWRQSFLVEYFSDTVMPRVRNMGYNAVRTRRWKLYDLERDPYELQNLGGRAGSAPVIAEMRRELERLRR